MSLKRHLYEGVSVTPNIEKHASAILYPLELKHPHPQFAQYDRLIINKIYDPQLLNFYNNHKNVPVLVGSNMYYRNPFDLLKVEDIDCKCDNKLLYEQLFGDITDQPKEVMAYKSCKHTIYAAAKRQMKMAPTPQPEVADDFLEYAKKVIEDEVGEELNHFSYSYQQWYSHLNKPKQLDMDYVAQYLNNEFEYLSPDLIKKIERTHYEGICKVELQTIDGKPRMVCSIPLKTKYIMGPVCWALEEVFTNKFRGYCGGKNLTQMADMVNDIAALGFTRVIEGDGSAFDNTQDISLKRVDHYIYSRVKPHIYHVDQDLFYKTATELYKTMDVLAINKDTKKKEMLFTYSILGSVFSGDADTTLMNTIRMTLYNRYINDKAGWVYGKDYICFSKGDDFTVMYKPYITKAMIDVAYYKYMVPAIKDVTKVDNRVYGLGQVLKMLDEGDLSSIKFCSLRAWYKNPEQIILTRDPAKFYNLSKYSRKIKTLKPYEAYMYCMQQAEALHTSYQGIQIFETMEEAYKLKAEQYLTMMSKEQQTKAVKSFTNKMLRMAAREERARAQISIYNMRETEAEKLMYNIKYRENYYKIQENYWETIQHIEKIRTDVLTEEEARYVNEQIMKEFDTEELKTTLGLNKIQHELKQNTK